MMGRWKGEGRSGGAGGIASMGVERGGSGSGVAFEAAGAHIDVVPFAAHIPVLRGHVAQRCL